MKELIKFYGVAVHTEEDVELLKKKILDLAVRGQLVEQDLNDEAADILVEKIKEQLSINNNSKKSISKLTDDQIPYELPTIWKWVKLGEIFELKSGTTIDKDDEYDDGPLIYLKVSNMNLEINKVEIISSSRFVRDLQKYKNQVIPKKSIIFPKRGGAISTNKKRIVTNEILVDTNIMAITCPENLNLSYIYYWFQTIDLALLNSGTSVPQINNKDIIPLWIPIPPLNEQKRIAAKVAELFALCDKLADDIRRRKQAACMFNLSVFNRFQDPNNMELSKDLRFTVEHMQELIQTREDVDQFKKSILSLAVRGKLVEQDPNEEPVNVLLKTVKKNALLPDITDEEIPFELPIGWAWTRLGHVLECIGGSQPPKKEFIYEPRDGYTRLVQIRDFKTDTFKTFIPNKFANRPFTVDDVMIGRYGPPIFQILRGLHGTYNVALMKAVPNEMVLTKDYVYYLLQEPRIQNKIISESDRTAGQSGVRKELIDSFIVALPPLKEQKRILDKVEQLLALCNKLIEQLVQNEDSRKVLMRSIV